MFNFRSVRSPKRVWTAILALVLVTGMWAAPFAAHAQSTPPPPPPPEESDPSGTPPTPSPTTPPTPSTPAPAPPGGTTGGGGGRYLLLPDISLNGIFLGHLSTDHRDSLRDRFRLDQAELAVQSYVYPQVKLDSFLVFAGGEAVVEEAFLTYQNVSVAHLPLSAVVGRRKVPFGRVNQLHPHAWLYPVQPAVLSNLVSGESLTGDGAYLSYLLPTGSLFAQLDAGLWSQSEATEEITLPSDPTSTIVTSPGAGFADKFGTVRLLLAKEALGGSLELGSSLAAGRGVAYSLANEGPNVRPNILLSGLDFTYRRAGSGAARLLLRGEYLQHRQKDGDFRRTVDGYYLFADQRIDAFRSIGLRYDSTGFPYADGRERGVSLIGTQQLTEATLYRIQLTHGDRPGKKNFDEIHLELIFGVGPHTHNLE